MRHGGIGAKLRSCPQWNGHCIVKFLCHWSGTTMQLPLQMLLLVKFSEFFFSLQTVLFYRSKFFSWNTLSREQRRACLHDLCLSVSGNTMARICLRWFEMLFICFLFHYSLVLRLNEDRKVWWSVFEEIRRSVCSGTFRDTFVDFQPRKCREYPRGDR